LIQNGNKAYRSGEQEINTYGHMVCWELWKERNRRIFDKKENSVQGLIRIITDEAKMWKQAGANISLVDQYGGAPFDPRVLRFCFLLQGVLLLGLPFLYLKLL
jgi:hypothetical protein